MHAVQKSGDDAQREIENAPAGQSVQTEAPSVSAYLPASHGRPVSKEVAKGGCRVLGVGRRAQGAGCVASGRLTLL